VLYTDGVTEAPNEDGKEFANARLADLARKLQLRTPREINDGILEAVQRFTGETAQRDDFTLVTVKRATAGAAEAPSFKVQAPENAQS
jgi:sigma-B regulation protein RsbU (phosphoserine phosphatase)